MATQLHHLGVRGFHISSAVFLAHASHQAYQSQYPSWPVAQGFLKGEFFSKGNIQGYWAAGEDVALLVFRGTSNLGQWIRDARIAPIRHHWGLVHAGFHSGLTGVETNLAAFDEVASQAHHVWVTGHSLGGALAVLGAARLKSKGISCQAYTYGQPRMGLANFRDRFDSELSQGLFRIINQNDVVARLPPGLIYRHCGQVKRIVRPGLLLEGRALLTGSSQPLEIEGIEPTPASEAEGLWVLNQLESNPNALNEISIHPEGRMTPGIFKDHFMAEYIRLLTEIRDKV